MSDYTFTMSIDGSAVHAAKSFGVVNPATGQVFAQCPDASQADLEAAVSAAARAYKTWQHSSLEERRACLACFKRGDTSVVPGPK